MATCANCGKCILEPNVSYGISPDAVCHCCVHDRRVAVEKPQVKLCGCTEWYCKHAAELHSSMYAGWGGKLW